MYTYTVYYIEQFYTYVLKIVRGENFLQSVNQNHL